MDILVVRHPRLLALVPATDLDAARMASLPRDYPLQSQYLLTRTAELNRWYRGGLARVADGMGYHPQALHNDIKAKAGLIEQILMFGHIPNAVSIKLRSTSFPEMQDDEFSNYCDFVTPCISRDYLHHIPVAQQRKQILEWFGRRPKLIPQPKVVLPPHLWPD